MISIFKISPWLLGEMTGVGGVVQEKKQGTPPWEELEASDTGAL